MFIEVSQFNKNTCQSEQKIIDFQNIHTVLLFKIIVAYC